MKTKKNIPLTIRLILGVILVAAIAALIWCVESFFGVTILATEEDKISNYLQIMGISFSVTFITTSLLGGLSDKTEKIYWLNYPESYLINSALNFMVLSTLSFLCLGIQTTLAVMIFLPEDIREAGFLASFLIGIITIVILSYKFTAVFFRRKKMVKKAAKMFDKMITDEKYKPELQRAVVGLFNNTMEVASSDSCNFERVNENIMLLLKYSDNDTCSFWLKKLVVEIGRNNTSMLSQLVLELEESTYYDKFTHLLEFAVLNKHVPFDGQELLNTIYDVRLKDFKKKLGSQQLFVDGSADGETYARWSSVARDLNILLTKIDVSGLDNCIFILKNLKELPFELLKNDNCMKKIEDVWDSILNFLTICINQNDTVSYQQLEKMMFDFLFEHPSDYFDTDMMFGCLMRESLSEDLHKKTSGAIGKMTSDQLSYMIDVIEDNTDRHKFHGWFVDRMARGEISEELWGLAKQADYNFQKKYCYSKDFSNCIINELIAKRNKLKNSYIERDSDGKKDRYKYNVEILEYNQFTHKFIRLLSRVKPYEDIIGEHSIERFLKIMFNDAFVGEANSFIHDAYSIDWEEVDTEETVLNCYVNAFEALIEENGLFDLRNAIELTDGNGEPVKNYFEPSSKIEEQKRSELLFFLAHIVKAIKDKRVDKENEIACVGIIARVLTNPCIGPVQMDTVQNPTEVNDSLSILRDNEVYYREALKFISDMNEEYSVLDNLYTGASVGESIGEPEYGAFLRDVADAFDNSIKALGTVLG